MGHELKDLVACNGCGQMCGWCEDCKDWRHRNPFHACGLIQRRHTEKTVWAV